jgi:hypothetical protein
LFTWHGFASFLKNEIKMETKQQQPGMGNPEQGQSNYQQESEQRSGSTNLEQTSEGLSEGQQEEELDEDLGEESDEPAA